eukprot:750882-Hanusia_phi.AAC.3
MSDPPRPRAARCVKYWPQSRTVGRAGARSARSRPGCAIRSDRTARPGRAPARGRAGPGALPLPPVRAPGCRRAPS